MWSSWHASHRNSLRIPAINCSEHSRKRQEGLDCMRVSSWDEGNYSPSWVANNYCWNRAYVEFLKYGSGDPYKAKELDTLSLTDVGPIRYKCRYLWGFLNEIFFWFGRPLWISSLWSKIRAVNSEVTRSWSSRPLFFSFLWSEKRAANRRTQKLKNSNSLTQ